MATLTAQHCLHHPEREAVARCPECARFYCRECITEHDDRVICSDCLRRLLKISAPEQRNFSGLWRGVAALAGFFLAWISLLNFGRLLAELPAKFHEGTIWSTGIFDPNQRSEP